MRPRTWIIIIEKGARLLVGLHGKIHGYLERGQQGLHRTSTARGSTGDECGCGRLVVVDHR